MKLTLKQLFFTVAVLAIAFPALAEDKTANLKSTDAGYSAQNTSEGMNRQGLAGGQTASGMHPEVSTGDQTSDVVNREALAETPTSINVNTPALSAVPASENTSFDADDSDTAQREPNNTAMNARDRDRTSITPLDQGNSRADTETTAAIRKDVLALKGISVDGQNVKIITQNGKVTLRGPVKTPEEKSLIQEIAGNQVEPQNVDNQLEVVGQLQRV